jgi:hypothetical protein
MIAFIDDHREAHGVEPICKVLPIAPSPYHKRADPTKLSRRAKRDVSLRSGVCSPRILRSTARARCGGNYGGRALTLHAAQSSG